MKKTLFFIVLLMMPVFAWSFSIHMHLESTKYKEVELTYVLCDTNTEGKCDENVKFTDTLKANDDLGIAYQGNVVVTAVTLDGWYPIWGPYPADLSKNICSSARSNAVTFLPNGGASAGITCIPSMG